MPLIASTIKWHSLLLLVVTDAIPPWCGSCFFTILLLNSSTGPRVSDLYILVYAMSLENSVHWPLWWNHWAKSALSLLVVIVWFCQSWYYNMRIYMSKIINKQRSRSVYQQTIFSVYVVALKSSVTSFFWCEVLILGV